MSAKPVHPKRDGGCTGCEYIGSVAHFDFYWHEYEDRINILVQDEEDSDVCLLAYHNEWKTFKARWSCIENDPRSVTFFKRMFCIEKASGYLEALFNTAG